MFYIEIYGASILDNLVFCLTYKVTSLSINIKSCFVFSNIFLVSCINYNLIFFIENYLITENSIEISWSLMVLSTPHFDAFKIDKYVDDYILVKSYLIIQRQFN